MNIKCWDDSSRSLSGQLIYEVDLTVTVCSKHMSFMHHFCHITTVFWYDYSRSQILTSVISHFKIDICYIFAILVPAGFSPAEVTLIYGMRLNAVILTDIFVNEKLLCFFSPLSQIDSIWALMLDWRIRGKINCSVLCYVWQLWTVMCTHEQWALFIFLHVRLYFFLCFHLDFLFFHISLCHFVLYCFFGYVGFSFFSN